MKLKERIYFFVHAKEIKKRLEEKLNNETGKSIGIENKEVLKKNVNKRIMNQEKLELYKRRLASMYEKNVFTLKDIAMATGINEDWVSKLILGVRRSKAKEEKIAKLLGCSRDYLFGKNSKEVA